MCIDNTVIGKYHISQKHEGTQSANVESGLIEKGYLIFTNLRYKSFHFKYVRECCSDNFRFLRRNIFTKMKLSPVNFSLWAQRACDAIVNRLPFSILIEEMKRFVVKYIVVAISCNVTVACKGHANLNNCKPELPMLKTYIL